MLNRFIARDHTELEAEDRVAVFDAHDAALKRSGTFTR
jgi:hypothetical protein